MPEEIVIKLKTTLREAFRDAVVRIEDSAGASLTFGLSALNITEAAAAPVVKPNLPKPGLKNPNPITPPVTPAKVEEVVIKGTGSSIILDSDGQSAWQRATSIFEPVVGSYPAYVRTIGSCFFILTRSDVQDTATLNAIIPRLVTVIPDGKSDVLNAVVEMFQAFVVGCPTGAKGFATGIYKAAHDCLTRRGLVGVC